MAETRAEKGKGKGKGKDKGKGKGKGKPNKQNKCPSVDKLEAMAMENYAGEICVFQELGWMDSDMNEMKEAIEADIDTLPNEISEALKGDKYDEEEQARLKELFTGIAETECFKTVFKNSCGSYVKNKLSDIIEGGMTAAGRK